MTSTASSSSRQRHTYTHHSDNMSDDDGDDYSDLDETEQDNLISNLTVSNDDANLIYTRLFTILPLIATIPFFVFLRVAPLGCLLSVTSLGMSAFTVGFVPLVVKGGGGGGAVAGTGTLSDIAHNQAMRRRTAAAQGGLGGAGGGGTVLGNLGWEVPFHVPGVSDSRGGGVRGGWEAGPVGRYIVGMNVGVCGVLVVMAVRLMGSEMSDGGDGIKGGVGGFWLLLMLPAVVCAVVVVVRGAMRETERGLGELRGLRYGYKGA